MVPAIVAETGHEGVLSAETVKQISQSFVHQFYLVRHDVPQKASAFYYNDSVIVYGIEGQVAFEAKGFAVGGVLRLCCLQIHV